MLVQIIALYRCLIFLGILTDKFYFGLELSSRSAQQSIERAHRLEQERQSLVFATKTDLELLMSRFVALALVVDRSDCIQLAALFI